MFMAVSCRFSSSSCVVVFEYCTSFSRMAPWPVKSSGLKFSEPVSFFILSNLQTLRHRELRKALH